MCQFEKDAVNFTLKFDSFCKALYDLNALQMQTQIIIFIIFGRK